MVSPRAALQLVHPITPEEKFQKWLSQLDDDALSCRAERGGRHDMPRLHDLPPGIQVRRRRGGVYEITANCKSCGLPGTLTTGKGGTLDGTETWQYDYHQLPGYLAPKGSGRHRTADFKVELGERVAPSIRQAAAATTAADNAAKRSAAAQRAARVPKTKKPNNNHGTNPRAVKHQRSGEVKVRHEREQRHGGSAS